jgi:fructose-bisphosphate aldolase class II
MPLVSAKRLLTCASRSGFAVPLFNVFELTCWVDFIRAAEDKSAPVIAGFYDGFLDSPDAGASIALIKHLAIRSSAPVALILDHGKSLENCIRALSLGFSDVMFDGSKLSFEDNVAQTSHIVHLAHACGAAVEAELGHVGSGSDYANQQSVRSGYTDPDKTVQFVKETGVDFLAVAIGTAHGVYETEPVLDLDRLAKIRSKVEIPLVLHGGTGLS